MTKPTIPFEEPQMKTWRVFSDNGNVWDIQAHAFQITPSGCLLFENDELTPVKAFSSTAWVEVEEVKGG